MSNSTKKKTVSAKPALSEEATQQRCTALAYQLVEKRLKNGTASATETVHFLKMGSAQARLELENKRLENKMIEAKIKALNSGEESSKRLEEAMKAFAGYLGTPNEEDE